MSDPSIRILTGIQLTIYIDDRKGTLADLTAFLGRNQINIYGLTLTDTDGHGSVRLIVDDTEKARQLIEDSGELAAVRQILRVRVGNKPGELGRVLSVLAAHDLNIEYGYSSGGPGEEKGLILVPSDISAAVEILEKNL